MNARTVIAAVAAMALAAPVAGEAKVVPAKHPKSPGHVVTHKQPRVLCICIHTSPGAMPVQSETQLEADIDADMIAHGLDPLYGTTTATTAITETAADTTAG